MKPKTCPFAPNPWRLRGLRDRATAWVPVLAAAVACIAGSPAFAELYDDFESVTRFNTLWTNWLFNGTGTQTVANGHVKLELTPTVPGGVAFCTMRSVRTWTLQEGRTLEFRTDLLSSNDDGAMAYLGFYLTNRCYGMAVDKDTVALLKRESPTQMFFLTNTASIKVSNVQLVISMTGVQSGVRLRFKILDNDNAGAVIFEQEYLDTAAADPMQVGTDAPAVSFLGETGYFMLSLFRDPALFDPDVTLPPGAAGEVVYDNAEVLKYASAWVAPPSTAVLMSWPEDTAEEQTVIGTDSLASDAVWVPWPEPIFKRFGQLSMAVPTTAKQQFFRLVPGTQFIDDFDAPNEPYASRNPWMPWFATSADAPRFTFTITNGVLQIQTLAQPANGQVMIYCPGTGPVVRDFYASVDILDWGSSSQESALGIGGRVTGDPNSPITAMYLGSFRVNAAGQPGKGGLYFFNGINDVPPSTFFDLKPDSDYRLQFSVVGKQLTVRLLDLTNGGVVDQQGIQSSVNAQGRVALWVNTRGSTAYTRAVGNFFMTGTKP